MPASRRPNLGDRRRLVIYSQRFNEDENAVAGRASLLDDQARRVSSAYGFRVQRRLRARWYGLVPVKRRTMLGLAFVLMAIVTSLGGLHWAALWLPQIANYPDVARPLRLDRPDSFGTWLGAMLLMMTAGASFLVYQLRRYSSDDYHGHYRIWRLAIVISLIASIDSVTGLIAWLGGSVDVLLAERDFLAGADWVRLLIGFGGAAFGLRMLGEVSRNMISLAVIGGSLMLSAVPLAVRWNLIDLEVATEALWIPILTLLSRTGLLIGTTIYLRMLYREVRKLEANDRLGDRLRRLLPKRRAKVVAEQDEKSAAKKPRSRPAKVSVEKSPEALPAASAQASTETEQPESKANGRSLWTRWLPAKRSPEEIESAKAEKAARKQAAADKAAKQKADMQAAKEFTQLEREEKQRAAAAEKEAAKLAAASAKQAAAEEKAAMKAEKKAEPAVAKPTASAAAFNRDQASLSDNADDDGTDEAGENEGEDSTDWDSLNKSERRRMRKLQKRQGRAA